ncbi:MAG: DUF1343 domain-containing protein [Flavobacteriales bacterium]|nr:DUF1343 domain-containing protein [Flavobacteriales bacterium]
MNQDKFNTSFYLSFKYTIILFLVFNAFSCSAQTSNPSETTQKIIEDNSNDEIELVENNEQLPIIVGAEQPQKYISLLKGKKVGVVTNQTGVIKYIHEYDCQNYFDFMKEKCKDDETIHLVDFLVNSGVEVKRIFAPEHGFRGEADAGETVKNGKDIKTNIPIISLYGKNKKPTREQISDLDIILFDIQDVGARFYTYISTLHYVMEAAKEYGDKQVLVLDRPNPNAHYVDGPVLDKNYESFVGMHQVPIVYGMTIGEYAKMINGERWLKDGIQANLKVIELKNYTHDSRYSLPVKPSPNLPNDKSINLYPSTCFFEGANVSEGRGTNMQFQVYGSPFLSKTEFYFVPEPNEGAKSPRFQGRKCYGKDLRNEEFLSEIKLSYLIDAYKNYNSIESFWIKNSGSFWIDKLAGTDKLRKQIDAGKTEAEIKESWKADLEEFKNIRSKYLIYP